MTDKIKPFATSFIAAVIVLSSIGIICTSALFEADFAIDGTVVTVLGKSFEINGNVLGALNVLVSFNEKLWGSAVWSVITQVFQRTVALASGLLDIFLNIIEKAAVQL